MCLLTILKVLNDQPVQIIYKNKICIYIYTYNYVCRYIYICRNKFDRPQCDITGMMIMRGIHLKIEKIKHISGL